MTRSGLLPILHMAPLNELIRPRRGGSSHLYRALRLLPQSGERRQFSSTENLDSSSGSLLFLSEVGADLIKPHQTSADPFTITYNIYLFNHVECLTSVISYRSSQEARPPSAGDGAGPAISCHAPARPNIDAAT